MPASYEFLGCGDSFASGGRFHSCHLVRSGGVAALVDCGATSPVALERRALPQPSITHVLVTHLHGDHFGGIPFLLLDAAYNRPRTTPLVVAGPPGVGARVLGTLDLLFPGVGARVRSHVPHRFVELHEPSPTDLDGIVVQPFAVQHPSGAPAYALRLTVGGRTIACSGDTEWTPALVDAARDADLFVCECFGWQTEIPSHLTHARLEAHASEFTSARMVLTHLGPEMLAHAAEARWPCASDGMTIEL